jgi:hypothetical protein
MDIDRQNNKNVRFEVYFITTAEGLGCVFGPGKYPR